MGWLRVLCRRLTSGDDAAAQDSACKIPLTERNIHFFNQSLGAKYGKLQESEDNDSSIMSELQSCRGKNKLYGPARELRVVEWLELSSSVRLSRCRAQSK